MNLGTAIGCRRLGLDRADAESLGPDAVVREPLQVDRDAGVGTFVASTFIHGLAPAKADPPRLIAELAKKTVAA